MPRILVVDDDENILDLVTQLLIQEGHEVSTAGNGANALEIIDCNYPPNLIILDLRMPVMTGEQMMTALNCKCDNHSPPVILLSGYLGEFKQFTVPPVAMITKPFKFDELINEVNKALASPNLTEAV